MNIETETWKYAHQKRDSMLCCFFSCYFVCNWTRTIDCAKYGVMLMTFSRTFSPLSFQFSRLFNANELETLTKENNFSWYETDPYTCPETFYKMCTEKLSARVRIDSQNTIFGWSQCSLRGWNFFTPTHTGICIFFFLWHRPPRT